MSLDNFNAVAETERLRNISENGTAEEKAAALDEIVKRQTDTTAGIEAAAAREGQYQTLMQEGTRESRRAAFRLKFEKLQ